MDYCDPCRRHLNGALACPGCGTSADTLRGRGQEYGAYGATAAGHSGAGPQGPDGPDAPDASDHGPDGYGGHDDTYDAPHAEDDVEDDGEHLGRAARRRGRGHGPAADGPGGSSRRDRKAAAHRRRRRRTLFVAAGFVLAAGGLSLAELGLDAPSSSPRPAAAGGESADGDASVEAGETGRGPDGKAPGADGTSTSASPSASDSPSASKSPKGEKSESPKGDEPTKGPESATVGGTPSRPASGPTAAPPAPEPAPTSGPTTQAPEPEPSASEPCKRFLWWCT
ncbi:hypothetical protein ACFXJM_11860 [Streptomyces massasporeus]